MNESDPRSNVHYLGSSENKAWKKMQACTGLEPMTSAIPYIHHFTGLFRTNIMTSSKLAC